MEIRSYRNVVEVERRIYRIDKLRLNPAGVPLRAIGCYAALTLTGVALAKLPVLGSGMQIAPWYLRMLLVPLALTVGLTAIRIDGRSSRLTIGALLRFATGSRSLTALRPACRSLGRRLRPGELVALADGSDARPRRMRYRGPGIARILTTHALVACDVKRIELRPAEGARAPARVKTVSLGAGACLEVAS